MDLSGVIFVVLALAWAGYLIPKALKHHDEVARSRSIDRFSNAMRVLARRDDIASAATVAPTASTATSTTAGRASSTQRRAAAVAARRRRRVLGLLLVADLAVAGLAFFAVLPWWAEAVPAGLTVVWLMLCRTQVRSQARAVRVSVAASDPVPAPDSAGLLPATQRAVNGQGFEEVSEGEDTMALNAATVAAAMAAPTAAQGSLWDPLPVTLPTYVTKPRARRTVRTIDLGAADTWTSGRDEGDSALVAEARAAEVAQPEEVEEASDFDEPEQQRAVGS